MHIHFLGVCGTFMASLALLARAQGHTVSGSDRAFYPPMSEVLREAGIESLEGYGADSIPRAADLVVIGNALSRGVAAVEAVLDSRVPYTSGAQYLADSVLGSKRTIAIAGTHGKTTTTALVTHVLNELGFNPGYLVGGAPIGFDAPSRLTDSELFVLEADEYDTAFFDKRSKVVLYRPDILLINNLEFDHADIFPDLAAIERQFHHAVRTVPGNGWVVTPVSDANVARVLDAGCWSQRGSYGAVAANSVDSSNARWLARDLDGQGFKIMTAGDSASVHCPALAGPHNQHNAAAALAVVNAATGAGIADIAAAMSTFKGVKRRLETVVDTHGILLLDDFAHHPTAIKATLGTVRNRFPARRLVALLELSSNSMRAGIHGERLGESLADADRVYALLPAAQESQLASSFAAVSDRTRLYDDADAFFDDMRSTLAEGDVVIMLSNGSFAGLRSRLATSLS